MQARALLLTVFLAYVALDLGCPLVPGAFNFDPAASVEGIGTYRTRSPVVSGHASLPAVLCIRPPVEALEHRAEVHVASSPVGWRPHAVRDRTSPAVPPRSVDDD